MNYVQVINIVAYVLCVVLVAVALYFKCKGSVTEAVSQLIALAEETELCGPEKMEMVVSRLYNMVPVAFRGFLTKERLEDIAQWIFDWMRKYADAYVSGFEDGSDIPDLSGVENVNKDIAADVMERLVKLSSESLRTIAVTLGIDVADMDDKEIIKAIALALLLKKGV